MSFVINVNSLMHFLDIPKMLLSSQLGYFNVVFDHAVLWKKSPNFMNMKINEKILRTEH